MKWIARWLMLNLFYIFAGDFLFSNGVIARKYFVFGYWALLVLNIIAIIVLLKKGYFKKKTIYFLMIVFVVLLIISTISAMDVEMALYGKRGRDEGLFLTVYYMTIMAIGSVLDKKNRKKVIIFALILGAIQCVIAFFQVYEAPFVRTARHYIGRRNGKKTYQIWATGFLGNPNFLASYILLCLSYAMGLFTDEKSRKKSIIYLLLMVLFFGGLLICNTMSCVVGLIAVIIVVIIFTLVKKRFWKLGIIVVTIIATTFAVIGTGKTTLVKDFQEMTHQTSEMAKGNVNGDYGTHRVYIWQNVLKVAPRFLWHGAGIDNFCHAFDDGCLKSEDKTQTYDKAHNEYLQILLTEGIFALITYLAIVGFALYRAIKNGFKTGAVLLILPVVGYLVQAFFNISVIDVAPIFFMTLGFCFADDKSNRKPKVLVVGNFGVDGKRDGQTVKTQTVASTLKKLYGKNVKTVDTHTAGLWSKIKFLFLVLDADVIFMMCAKGSLKVVIRVLKYMHALKKTNYVVIGGWLYDFVVDDKKMVRRLKKMNRVLVETKSLEKKLTKLGVKTTIIPNYRIYDGAPKLKEKCNKYVFYSRVIKEKGVLIAIDAVKALGRKVGLDIYGPVDKKFEKEFQAAIRKSKNIKYQGVLENEKEIVEVLSQYRCLILPTFYEGEGAPGVIVEAMKAGVPVMASDWKYNSEIIKDGRTGFIVKDNSVTEYVKVMKQIEGGKIDLAKMSKNCTKEVKKYTEENAVKVLESVMHE